MEKGKVLNMSDIRSVKNKEKVADKIDSLWSDNSSSHRNPKVKSNKILIKLNSNGIEKRKFMLKMESESQNNHSRNYSFICELLKDFFNSSSNSE